MATTKATVIYDSDCGFCKWCLALLLSLERRGGRGALRPLPLGTAEADRLLVDLTVEQRNASWHLVVDDPGAPVPARAASDHAAPDRAASDPAAPRPATPDRVVSGPAAVDGLSAPAAPLRLSAGTALAPAMALVRGGRVPGALFGRFPGASERGYRWVADHRPLLGRLVPGRARRWADRVIAAHGEVPQ